MSGLVQIYTRTCTHMYSVKVPLHFQEMVGIVMLVSKAEFRPVSKTLLHSMKRVDIYKTTADEYKNFIYQNSRSLDSLLILLY